MLATTLSEPLTVKQGDKFQLALVVQDHFGDPIDLYGRTACMQWRRSPSHAPALTLSSGNGGIIYDGESFTLMAPAETMQEIPVGNYMFDFQTTSSDGTVETLLSGVFTVIADVTYGC